MVIMKTSIKISSNTRQGYFPKDLIEVGYIGRVPLLVNASTIVLLHPRASLEDVEKSLKIVLKDVALRIKLEKVTHA